MTYPKNARFAGGSVTFYGGVSYEQPAAGSERFTGNGR